MRLRLEVHVATVEKRQVLGRERLQAQRTEGPQGGVAPEPLPMFAHHLAGPRGKEHLLVIAQQRDEPAMMFELDEYVEHSPAIGAAIDVVAQCHERVARRRLDLRQGAFAEAEAQSVNIADGNCASPARFENSGGDPRLTMMKFTFQKAPARGHVATWFPTPLNHARRPIKALGVPKCGSRPIPWLKGCSRLRLWHNTVAGFSTGEGPSARHPATLRLQFARVSIVRGPACSSRYWATFMSLANLVAGAELSAGAAPPCKESLR